MKRQFMLALILALSVFQSDFAKSGQDGNGGGVIQDGAQLNTLAQAGVILERASNLVRSPKYPEYYKIAEETKTEVKRIVSLFPLNAASKENLVEEVLGNRITFVTTTHIDPVEQNKIVSDYSVTLKKYGQRLNEGPFKLAAVTKGYRTYILSAFLRLDPIQQALILIHENNFRSIHVQSLLKNKLKLLALNLELDSQIFRMLEAHSSGVEFDPMKMIAILKDLGLASDYTVAYYAVRTLQEKLPGPLLLEDLILVDSTDYRFTETDPSLVQKLNSIDPRALQIFEHAQFRNRPSSMFYIGQVRASADELSSRVCNENYPQMKDDERFFIYSENDIVFKISCNNIYGSRVLDIQGARAVY